MFKRKPKEVKTEPVESVPELPLLPVTYPDSRPVSLTRNTDTNASVITPDAALNRVVWFPGNVIGMNRGVQRPGYGIHLPQFKTLPNKGFVQQGKLVVLQTGLRSENINMIPPDKQDRWYSHILLDGRQPLNHTTAYHTTPSLVYKPVYPGDEISKMTYAMSPCGVACWEVPELKGWTVEQVKEMETAIFGTLLDVTSLIPLADIEEKVYSMRIALEIKSRLIEISHAYRAHMIEVIRIRNLELQRSFKSISNKRWAYINWYKNRDTACYLDCVPFNELEPAV